MLGICPICKNDFEVTYENQKYCSEICRSIKAEQTKFKTMYIHKCKKCGSIFQDTNNKTKYCSKECRTPKVKTAIKKTSAKVVKNTQQYHTGYDFEWKPLLERPTNYWMLGKLSKAKKDKILKRDGYRCQVCGNEIGLQIHHIIKRTQGGSHEDDNLITLCTKCHKYIDKGDTEKAVFKILQRIINDN